MKTHFQRLKYSLGLGLGSLLIISGLFAAIAPASHASALDTNLKGTWVSSGEITVGGRSFTGPLDSGGKVIYQTITPNTAASGCGSERDAVIFDNNPTVSGASATPAKMRISVLSSPTGSSTPPSGGLINSVPTTGAGSSCVTSDRTIDLANPGNARLTKAQASCGVGTIRSDTCINNEAIKICGTSGSQAVLTCIANQKAMPAGGITPTSTGPLPVTTVAAPATDPAAGSGDPSLDCGFDGGVLNWILCPVLKIVNLALNGLDAAINSLLEVDQKKIFDQCADPTCDTGRTYYAAWQAFRGIALGLLIAAALIMIVSQALGFEFFDAYTIKKVLPRLVVAIIGIALSWELMKWFVGFTNDLGMGVRGLIYYPFSQISQKAQFLTSGSGFLVGLLLSGAGLGLGFVGLLSLGLTALLAIFMAFIVLVLRQLVIVMLILMAPIAIAAYILPNTQSIWKLWHESFSKALLMYPMIMGFLAIGRVMAVTSSGPGSTALGQLIGMVAYVLPYFLIPATFRFAGGALRTIGGFANDRSRGVFDRLKKGRSERVSNNIGAMKQGTRFKNNSAIARGFNRTTQGIATAPSAGLNPRQWRSRYGAAHASHTFTEAEEIRTKNADFALGAQDDRLLRVAGAAEGRGDIRRRLQGEGITDAAALDSATGIVERMQSSGSQAAVRQAVALQRFATGTGYNDANGNFDAQAAMDSIRDASHGDRALAGRLLGSAKGLSTQAGQLAFGGASYGTLSDELDHSFAPGGVVNGNRIALNAFESNDSVTNARARTPHVHAMTRAVSDRIAQLQAGTAAPRDPGELGRLAAQMENFRETTAQYGAPDRQNTIVGPAGDSSQQIRRDLAQEANAYNAHAAAHQAGQAPAPPRPSADLLEYMRNRSSRMGNPNDPGLPQAGP